MESELMATQDLGPSATDLVATMSPAPETLIDRAPVPPRSATALRSTKARRFRAAAAILALREGAEEHSKLIHREDFDLVRGFYREFIQDRAAREQKELYPAPPREAMESHLRGSTELAVRLRAYLGEDADYASISDLLTNEVSAMTTAHRWSTSGKLSIARAILTKLHNDMDRENYAVSILFFRGCCCYCEKQLSRSAGGNVALPTGEHITPISPEPPGSSVGGTRFGNVALACARCNKSRSNSELHQWLKSAMPSTMTPDTRAQALARIAMFRKFAGYRDYSAEETAIIRESVARLQAEVDAARGESGRILRGAGFGDPIRRLIAAEVELLAQKISA